MNLPNDLTPLLRRLADKVGSMDARLQRIEDRQHDTRPIWERALQEISEARAEMQRGFFEVRKEMSHLNRQMRALNDNMLKMQADIRGLDERVYDLETKSS